MLIKKNTNKALLKPYSLGKNSKSNFVFECRYIIYIVETAGRAMTYYNKYIPQTFKHIKEIYVLQLSFTVL